MTLKEMIEFDILRYKQERTVVEEVRYRDLLERVIRGADGLSEFYTNPTEAEKQMNEEMHKELCTRIASRFFKDLAMYGPVISDTVVKIIIGILKTLGKL